MDQISENTKITMKTTIFGLFFLGIICSVLALPADNKDLDVMQSDDYYADDESSDLATSPQPVKGSKAYFLKPNSTVAVTPGKDVVLKCEVENLTNEVLLWYKEGNVIATAGNVILPMYSVDNNRHTLTIINATESSQGDYYCELEPGNKRLYTKVVIAREPLEEVIPESSPSMQNNSAHAVMESVKIILSVFALHTVLRI